jgi:hypothetical protein
MSTKKSAMAISKTTVVERKITEKIIFGKSIP